MKQIRDEQIIRIYRYGIDFDIMLNIGYPTHIFIIGNYRGEQYAFHPHEMTEKYLKEVAEKIKRQ